MLDLQFNGNCIVLKVACEDKWSRPVASSNTFVCYKGECLTPAFFSPLVFATKTCKNARASFIKMGVHHFKWD